MPVLDNDRQYTFDLSIDLGDEQKDEIKTDSQVVSLSRVIHHQERVQAVSRLRDSQIFDTSRFERLIKLR